MRLLGGLLFALGLLAQEPAPIGVARGVLLEWDALAAGEFSIRADGTNRVYRFTFDPKTYVERDQQRISMTGLRKGDAIEVVSDEVAGVSLRYARTVHVVERRPAPRSPASAGMLRPYRSPLEHIVPRGDLTFSGIIARLSEERLVLRTRLDGEKTILLRRDTRYLESGSLVEAGTLKPNTRVFVRAGKNLDDEIEAYQVIWGEILEPGRLR